MAKLDNMFGDMEELEKMLYGDVEGDPELEAELLALEAENEEEIRSAPPPVAPRRVAPTAPPVAQKPVSAVSHLIAVDPEPEEDQQEPPQLLIPEPVVAKPIQTELKPPGTLLEALEQRMAKYKETGARAAQEGHQSRARMMTRIQNQYATAIRAHKAGKAVDLGELPTPLGFPGLPGVPSGSGPPSPVPQRAHQAQPLPSPQEVKAPIRRPPTPQEEEMPQAESPAEDEPEDPKPSPPPLVVKPLPAVAPKPVVAVKPVMRSELKPPGTLLEALEQRMAKYKETGARAAQEGDQRRARMMTRIQNQYATAIRAHKAGKVVDVGELPTPPGCPPLPGVAQTPEEEDKPVPQPPSLPRKSAEGGQTKSPSVATPSAGTSGGGPPKKQARQQQQLEFLTTRQMQFKKAALTAKQNGDLITAKKLLKQAKGFDQMIEASRSGLPVDISKIPTPPQFKTSGAVQPIVTASTGEDVSEGWSMVQGGEEEIYATLEKDLIRQIQISEQNQEYFTRLGDVRRVTTFEKMGAVAKKDLVTLRQAFKHGDPPPRFRYVLRTFPSLETCVDLGEDEMEIGVVRGIQVKLPSGYEDKDAEIFVRFTFPFPQEAPQAGKTASIQGTSSPAWSEKTKFKLNRKSRQLLRLVKRHGVKFEVFQKGSVSGLLCGFLRSDKSLGSCEAKLLPLETKSQIHESLDLMEGRKQIGGKLEIRIRIREPLVKKETTEVQEKWLVIDEFLRPSALAKRTERAKAVVAPKVKLPPISHDDDVILGLPKIST